VDTDESAAGFTGVDDPPSVADEPIVAAVKSTTVATRIRFGVSQVMC
jgi:hypothetical protein